MPSNFKSPFASAFKSACKRGTPYCQVVENIAKKNNKSEQIIWNSLWKANLVWRQKFNSQWIYFPSFPCKTKASGWKNAQFQCWQFFCEWMLCSGQCTPEQLKKACSSQTELMKWCKKFWGKQFTSSSTSTRKTTGRKTTAKRTTTKRTTTRKSTSKKATRTASKKRTPAKSYKFPSSRSTSRTRRFTKAA